MSGLEDARAPKPREIYTLKSRQALNTLRLCGIIDLVIGIPVTLAAIGMGVDAFRKLVTGDLSSIHFEAVLAGLLVAIGGSVAIGAGQAMLLSRVKLTEQWLSSGGSFIPRRWLREEIVAIDIRQHNLGRMPRAVPFVVLRDGRSAPLTALAYSSTTPGILGAGTSSLMSGESQLAAVAELRGALNVGGSDLLSG